MKEFFSKIRKKLSVTVIGLLTGLVVLAFGEVVSGTIIICVSVASFNFGQGIADAGKEKAQIEMDI